MSKRPVISETEIKRIVEHLEQSYQYLGTTGRNSLMRQFIKTISEEDGIKTSLHVYVFDGDQYRMAHFHIHVQPIQQRTPHMDDVDVNLTVLSLEELIEAEALQHHQSLFPSDMDKVKEYLSHLFHNDDEKLKEYLPGYIYKAMERGQSCMEYSYTDIEVLFNALRGNFNINGCSFKISEVSHIRYLDNACVVVLKSGTEITTSSDLERRIIREAFGHNYSNRVYNK